MINTTCPVCLFLTISAEISFSHFRPFPISFPYPISHILALGSAPFANMLTFKSHAEALDLLSSLTHNLYPLAAQGTPEDRVEAFEHADFLRRYFDYFDADFKAQLPCFPEVGPAADALHGQIRELGLLLAQVDEITVFWDTGIFVNDPEVSANPHIALFQTLINSFLPQVPGTPSSSSSSSDSVFSRPSSVPRRVRPDRPEPIITPQEHLISM